MTRRIISKKKRIDEINQLNKENEPEDIDHTKFSLTIRERAAGSISNLPVKSKEHGTWLAELQDKNPFIGKSYMVRASEYETDDKILTPEEAVVAEEEFIEELDAGLEAYDPNVDYGDEAEEREDKRHTGGAEGKMIDHCIISNTARKLIGVVNEDEIKTRIVDELADYHGDTKYQTDVNIEASIEHTKTTLLLASDGNKSIESNESDDDEKNLK